MYKVKVILRLTISQSVSLGIEHPPGAHDQIFIAPLLLRSSFCGAPSLTRRCVCLLYMLLALASAVFLESSRVPLYSRPYFTVSDLRLLFSSPPTTRRVTVEVFDPASTRGLCINQSQSIKVKVKVILRLTISQPVSLGIEHPPALVI
jgi:hypothetical protein